MSWWRRGRREENWTDEQLNNTRQRSSRAGITKLPMDINSLWWPISMYKLKRLVPLPCAFLFVHELPHIIPSSLFLHFFLPEIWVQTSTDEKFRIEVPRHAHLSLQLLACWATLTLSKITLYYLSNFFRAYVARFRRLIFSAFTSVFWCSGQVCISLLSDD